MNENPSDNFCNLFTKEYLEKMIDTGKNYVFAYPAGTGKTTAICEYIACHLQEPRKIIYVAATKSLLDTMYKRLLDAGVFESKILNYHSSNPALKKYFRGGSLDEDAITDLIRYTPIILITHERLQFDATKRYLSEFDFPYNMSLKENKPLIFIDESIDSYNILQMSKSNLEFILMKAGLITYAQTADDYNLKEDCLYQNINMVAKVLMSPDKIINNRFCMKNLKDWDFTLTDPTGFISNNNEMSTTLKLRYQNLYTILAGEIANKNWVSDGCCVQISLPLAIHLNWLNYAQCIVMDATGNLNKSFYKDYELIVSDNWNFDKLTNYVFEGSQYTKTKMKENPAIVKTFLDKIPIQRYNKIYLVTFKGVFNEELANYFREKYPEYKIEWFETNDSILTTNQDELTDECYSDSGKESKIIYVTNYGRTRGSNCFRECDCVIQIGTYRKPIDTNIYLKRLYPDLDENELPTANFVQEIYRGRIRCNEKMDTYTVMDRALFLHSPLQKNLRGLRLRPYVDSVLVGENIPLEDSHKLEKDIIDLFKDKDLKIGEIVFKLFDYKFKKKIIKKEDLFKIFENNRLDKCRSKILSLYKDQSLKDHLFNNFRSIEDLEKVLILKSKNYDLELKLY